MRDGAPGLAARNICMPLLTMGEGARVKNAVDSHLIVRRCLKVRVVCQILKTF